MATAISLVLSGALAAGGLFNEAGVDLYGASIPGVEAYFPGTEERPRNVLMINPLALAAGAVEVTYEHAVTVDNSWGAMVGLVSLESGSEKVSAAMVNALFRGYPGRTAPQGGFYAVGVGFVSLSYRNSAAPSDDVDLTTLAYLVYGGQKWLSDQFAFEVGAGIMSVAGPEGTVGAGFFLELAVGFAF